MYGAASKETALATPVPDGTTLEDRRIFFVTFMPDDETLTVHKVPDEEVQGADVRVLKRGLKDA